MAHRVMHTAGTLEELQAAWSFAQTLDLPFLLWARLSGHEKMLTRQVIALAKCQN